MNPRLRPYLRKPFSLIGRLFSRMANAIYKAPPGPRLLQTQRVAPWFAAGGELKLRLQYDLGAGSIVFDLGGYEGQWASDITAMYGCRILVFEPMAEYATKIKARFAANPKIETYQFGLSDHDYQAKLSIDLASSSLFKTEGAQTETIELKDAAEFIRSQKIGQIDLMKINIEGGEYDLLDRLIETGLIERIIDLQVQFHDFAPNAEKRMAKIQAALRKTHYPTYQYPFVWENWRHRQTLPQLASQAPRVSVLMAVYNSGPSLKEAIQSILDQSFAPFELIIINDGSTDSSEKIIKSFKDPRIVYIKHKNRGLAASLNRGLEAARGEYVARMDSDDVSQPTRLQAQVNYLDQHPEVALVGTSYDVVDEKLKYRESFTALSEPDDVAQDFFVRNPFGHGTVMFRKTAVKGLGGYDETPGFIEDYDLWWRISQKYAVANLAEPLYLWRVVSNSISHGGSAARQEPIQTVIKSIWNAGGPRTLSIGDIRQRLAQYEQSEPSEIAQGRAEQYLLTQYALCLGLIAHDKWSAGAVRLARTWLTAPGSLYLLLNLNYRNRSMRGYTLNLMLKPLSPFGRGVRKILTSSMRSEAK